MLQIRQYGDLHKKVVEFDPLVINPWGKVACSVKFFCAIDNRKITRGFLACPNGTPTKRFGSIAQALAYVLKNGEVERDDYRKLDFGLIQPAVNVVKAYQLKDRDDPWHTEKNRYVRMRYKSAIVTPTGTLDIVAVYRNSKFNRRNTLAVEAPTIHFDFVARPLNPYYSARTFREEHVEEALVYLDQGSDINDVGFPVKGEK